MGLGVDIAGRGSMEFKSLVLDLNGTISAHGSLIPGVADHLTQLRDTLEVVLLSADTFGTAAAVAGRLSARLEQIRSGHDKQAVIERLGAAQCVAIGNGANDIGMLSAAGLGIAIIGPEGASAQAIAAADIVCASILDGLALLNEPKAINATLRP